MLKHAFVNGHSDGTDSTKTQPSHWNAEHPFDGGTHGSLLYRDTGASNGANWLGAGTAGFALISNGAGAIPSWGAVITPVFPLAASAGGTGVANNVANTITFTGAFGLGLTLTGATNITLPTSGTLLSTAASVTPAQGGTGVANGTNNTLTFTGNFTLGLTLTGNTSVTLPTSGTLLSTASAVTPAQGGTGIANNAANTITFSGNFGLALTLTGATALTLPTSGTLLTTTGNGSALTGLADTQLSFTDNVTGNVSTAAHGYMVKAPNDNSKVFQGDGTYAVRVSTVTVSTTGNLNGAWVTLPKTGRVVIYMTNASLSTIQSIPAGYDGQEVSIISQGVGQVDLAHNSGSGTAGQKLNNFVTSASSSLSASVGSARFVFDATNTRWNMAAHVQGAWLTSTFSAGNFSGNGSMTWTVGSSDVTELKYYLEGRKLIVNYQVGGTIGGVVNSTLSILSTAYGSFIQSASSQSYGFCRVNNGGTAVPSFCNAPNAASSHSININHDLNTANYTAGSVSVIGSIAFEVQ